MFLPCANCLLFSFGLWFKGYNKVTILVRCSKTHRIIYNASKKSDKKLSKLKYLVKFVID